MEDVDGMLTAFGIFGFIVLMLAFLVLILWLLVPFLIMSTNKRIQALNSKMDRSIQVLQNIESNTRIVETTPVELEDDKRYQPKDSD